MSVYTHTQLMHNMQAGRTVNMSSPVQRSVAVKDQGRREGQCNEGTSTYNTTYAVLVHTTVRG